MKHNKRPENWSEMSEDIRLIIGTDQKILDNIGWDMFKEILANDITRYIFKGYDVNNVFAGRKRF